MKNRFYRIVLTGILSAVLMCGTAMPAFAATDPKDQWGPIPDDFVFEGYSTGKVYADPPKSTAPANPAVSDGFNYTLEEFAAIHLEETNRIREEYGLNLLKTDPTLTKMAQARMDENNGVMTHTRPDNSYYWSIFDEYETNLKAYGENITSAGDTPANSARGFLETKHRENVLRPDAEYIGIGIEWVDTIIGRRIAVLQLFAKE